MPSACFSDVLTPDVNGPRVADVVFAILSCEAIMGSCNYPITQAQGAEQD